MLLKIFGLLVALTVAAAAEDYPDRPVRIIVPFSAGGGNDIVGRLVANQLSMKLGQQFFVDNRGGAGGVIGTDAAAHAIPDGYTLLMVSIAHTINPSLYKLNYDPIKSFAPIAIFATSPNVLAVNPQLPVNSVRDLLVLAKERPGELEFASAGIGSFDHLGGELFKIKAGVNLLHVPYKGGGAAITDLLGGHVKIIFGSLLTMAPYIQSGQLKALGTGGSKRNFALPDVPTIAEAGVPGYEANNWWGIVAPAGTPAEVIAKLATTIAQVQDLPEVQKQFSREGAEIVKMTPTEFGEFMVAEIKKWGRVVKHRDGDATAN